MDDAARWMMSAQVACKVTSVSRSLRGVIDTWNSGESN
jgi:hypothetical protein